MRALATIVTLILLSTSVFGQHYDFSSINNTHGLTNNQVKYIFKDSQGFIWFATNTALNRYDGIDFKEFKQSQSNPSMPPHRSYSEIREDGHQRLWFTSYESGFAVYDMKTERFIRDVDSLFYDMGLPSLPTIIDIDDNKNIFCYYQGQGIYKYDNASGEVVLYSQDNGDRNKISEGRIDQMNVNNESIWLLFERGLVERFNQTTNMIDIRDNFYERDYVSSTIKKFTYVDRDNDLWVYPSLDDKWAGYYDSKRKRWEQLGGQSQSYLSSDIVRAIAQADDGLFWIGTDHGGVNIYNKETKKTTVLQHDIYNVKSIAQNTVISLYCDDEGIMWAGTFKNGVSYYHPKIFKFNNSELARRFKKEGEIIDCNSLYKDHEGNLWIGTDGSGLIRYNEERDEVRVFKHDPNNPNSISSNVITSIYEDQDNTLWVGTFLGGLNAYKGGRFIRYTVNEQSENSISNKSIFCLTEDSYNTLWIGTLGAGIDRLSADRKSFENFNPDNTEGLQSGYIMSMHRGERDNNIYVCTDSGVSVINSTTGTITALFSDGDADSLANLSANYILVDSRSLIWIATDGGLYIYDQSNNNVQFVSVSDGMPNDEVVSLIEDDDGTVWAGTRNGLCAFHGDLEGGEYRYFISSFDTRDGLPSSVCNLNSVYKEKGGELYIGCTNGYVLFDPNEIHKLLESRENELIFTELLIANNSIKPNVKYNGRVIIDNSISMLDELTLHHGETNFTLNFSSLNFLNPKKTNYRYMLRGLDEGWTETKGGIGSVSYSNLKADKYKLIIQASEGNRQWSETPLVLDITVRPHWAFSLWAWVIYALVFAFALYQFISWILNKQKHKFEQAQKIQEATRLHELDAMKLKFFTNISHEFKTPLTLIITPLQKLLREDNDSETEGILKIVHRNAVKLLKMVDEILDFRKLDLGKMTINYSTGNIIPFLRDICMSFSSLASERSIKLTFTTFINEIVMEFDRDFVTKIVENLLSNAFKYTEEGQIDMSIGVQEELQSNSGSMLSIKISDTGVGIKEEHLSQIFNRFYRIAHPLEEPSKGTGIGLHLANEYARLHGGRIEVKSQEGVGSIFTLMLPIKKPNDEHESIEIKEATERATKLSEDVEIKQSEAQSVNVKNLPTLLIVDDNEDFCSFIKSVFIDEYRVETAFDGEEASRLVLELLPDIILSDVMMPKMDGYEFCRRVKEDIRTSHIPIILLTAKTSEESKYLGVEAGADDYISKPFNIELLTLKIEKIVEKKRLMQSRFSRKIDLSPSEIEIKTMDEKFIEKAISVVEENMDNTEFLVQDLCREMAMSRVYFYKKIMALTDKSPSEFIRYIRLQRAAELLEKSQMFINEIAFQVGFNDPRYFRKHFKDEFGMTPSEYKKKSESEG